jgi:hypothetical protein
MIITAMTNDAEEDFGCDHAAAWGPKECVMACCIPVDVVGMGLASDEELGDPSVLMVLVDSCANT